MKLMSWVLAAAVLSLSLSAPVQAAACRDAKGKFVKCPDKPKAGLRCKDAKGKFAKCGTPGAKAIG